VIRPPLEHGRLLCSGGGRIWLSTLDSNMGVFMYYVSQFGNVCDRATCFGFMEREDPFPALGQSRQANGEGDVGNDDSLHRPVDGRETR